MVEKINNPEKETQEYLYFGPINPDLYPEYAKKMLEGLYGPNSQNEKAKKNRLQMWANYEQLTQDLKELPADHQGCTMEFVEDFIRVAPVDANNPDFAKKQLDEKPPGGLGAHLREVEEVCREMVLTDDGAESKIPSIISSRDAKLFTYATARLHDLFKFLGTFDAQVMPDHEIMTAELIKDTFVGKKIKLGDDPELSVLSQEDVDFISGVIRNHENIFKEASRLAFIFSGDRIVRGQALFFLVDVMGSGLKVQFNQEQQVFEIVGDLEALIKRFDDLYFRHIDLVEGKAHLPGWGEDTVGDIISTLTGIEESGEMSFSATTNPEQNIALQLIGICQNVLAKVEKSENYHLVFNECLKSRDLAKLVELKQSLESDSISGLLQVFKKKLNAAVEALQNDAEADLSSFMVPLLNDEQKTQIDEIKSRFGELGPKIEKYVDVRHQILVLKNSKQSLSQSEVTFSTVKGLMTNTLRQLDENYLKPETVQKIATLEQTVATRTDLYEQTETNLSQTEKAEFIALIDEVLTSLEAVPSPLLKQ